MDGKTEGPRRRPSIEVRCPKCGTRTVWHRLPRAGDECRWCGHASPTSNGTRPRGCEVDGEPNRGCLLVLLAALAIDLMVLRGCMALAAALAG